MKKIIIIGHMDWQNNHKSGAVIKARNIYNTLIDIYGINQIDNLDIFAWKKNKFIIAYKIFVSFAVYKNIIFVISETNSKLMLFFRYLKKIFNKNVIYIVVGGAIAETLATHPKRIKLLDFISFFLVETADCLNAMRSLGFTNTKLMRNFKRIDPVNQSKKIKSHKDYYFCTFSRVVEEKGITQASEAIEYINKLGKYPSCYLDVYGDIDPNYMDSFNKILTSSPHVRYCGTIDSDHSVSTLKDYYCLLFPTLSQTEGIPGTIIDAFAAALPVICSNWCRCKDIIKDGENGLIYPFGEYNELVNKMIYVINNPTIVEKISKMSLREFSKYKPEIAIQPLLDCIK